MDKIVGTSDMKKEADIIYHLLFPVLCDRSENQDGFRAGWNHRDVSGYGRSAHGRYYYVTL